LPIGFFGMKGLRCGDWSKVTWNRCCKRDWWVRLSFFKLNVLWLYWWDSGRFCCDRLAILRQMHLEHFIECFRSSSTMWFSIMEDLKIMSGCADDNAHWTYLDRWSYECPDQVWCHWSFLHQSECSSRFAKPVGYITKHPFYSHVNWFPWVVFWVAVAISDDMKLVLHSLLMLWWWFLGDRLQMSLTFHKGCSILTIG